MSFSYLLNSFSLEAGIVTCLITIVRVFVESSATILVGVIAAAVIRCWGGYPTVESWLGPSGSLERTFRIMGACCCVPLCALGVLPVIKELSDSGMPRRDLAVVWLVAPLLNPLSLLYAVSILPAWQFGVFVVIACLFGGLVSEVAGRFTSSETANSLEVTPPAAQGTTRLWNGAIAVGRIVTGWALFYIAAGAVISGVIISFIPATSFERIFAIDNPAGPLEAMTLTAPQAITPISFTMAVAAIRVMHLAFACAISLQLLGVAWCGGTVLAMRSIWGWKRTMGLFCATLFLAVAASYGAYATSPPLIGEAEESHGLDTLARPYHPSFQQFSVAVNQQLQHTDAIMRGGAVLLLLTVLWGVVVRVGKFQYREQIEAPESDAKGDSRWNVELSPGQIGVVSLVLLAVCCVMVMYALFPSVEESFAQMQDIQADAVMAVKNSRTDLAAEKITQWDTVAARLPVGWVLRFGMPSANQAAQIRRMRELLWDIRQQMKTERLTDNNAREQSNHLKERFQECRDICLGKK